MMTWKTRKIFLIAAVGRCVVEIGKKFITDPEYFSKPQSWEDFLKFFIPCYNEGLGWALIKYFAREYFWGVIVFKLVVVEWIFPIVEDELSK